MPDLTPEHIAEIEDYLPCLLAAAKLEGVECFSEEVGYHVGEWWITATDDGKFLLQWIGTDHRGEYIERDVGTFESPQEAAFEAVVENFRESLALVHAERAFEIEERENAKAAANA